MIIDFFGDSITEGAMASSQDKCFVERVGQLLNCTVINHGVSGTRFARQKEPSSEPRFDLDFCYRLKDLDKNADYVFVFGGTNDYGHGDAAKGRMTDRTPDTFYGALHDLYQKVQKTFPEAEIIVMTPVHRTDEARDYNEIGIRNWGTLGDYVEIIREVAQYYALPVVDLYKESGIEPQEDFIRERYCPDGLHPNDAGHERIYRLLKGRLEQI